MDQFLQVGVELDQEGDHACAALGHLGDKFVEQWAAILRVEIGGEFELQVIGVFEREFFGIGLDEEVEGVDDRELRREVDLDLELRHRLREDKAGEPVAVRILLPVHEMLVGRHLERIARHLGSAMGRRPQTDRLRSEHDRPVIGILGDVVQADENRQNVFPFAFAGVAWACKGRAVCDAGAGRWMSMRGAAVG